MPSDKIIREHNCAAKALGKQKVSEKINSLASLLNDSTPFVQIAAIESLGILKDGKYSTKLLEFVNNQDADISQAAIIALGNMDIKEDEKLIFQNLLEKQIENPNWVVRKAIATTLGKLNTDEAFELLLRMLAQENEYLVDKEILFSLGNLNNSKDTLPLLINFTTESSLRENTLDILSKLGKIVIPFLQKALENDDSDIRANIVSILSRISDDKSMQILVKLASSDSSAYVRKQAVLALNNFNHDQRAIWAIMWAANHDVDSLVVQTAKSLLIS